MTNLDKPNHKSKNLKSATTNPQISTYLIDNQIVIELIGSSMEPNYANGTKVRCEEITSNNWPYIHGGVYAVKCLNSLIVKRVRREPRKGTLRMHSDNPLPGERLNISLKSVSNIWKVTRIIDAPAI